MAGMEMGGLAAGVAAEEDTVGEATGEVEDIGDEEEEDGEMRLTCKSEMIPGIAKEFWEGNPRRSLFRASWYPLASDTQDFMYEYLRTGYMADGHTGVRS